MGTRDPRIDAYIAKSADFAKPILRYLRETIHSACPDVQETIKWGTPSHQREYIEWIAEAKTDETRTRRVDAAVEWIAEGKPRNWKYMKR
jgi:hypothetical protein